MALRANEQRSAGDFARFARLLAAPCPAAAIPFARLLATLPPHATGLCSFARTAKRMSGRAMSLFVVAHDEPWPSDHQRHMRRRWGRRGQRGRERGNDGLGVAERRRGRCSTAWHRIEYAHRVGHGDCKRHDQANQSGCRGLCFPWNANRFWFGPIFMESTA